MMIHDVIREAATEHEIRFLLTAYVEAVRYGDRLCGLPGAMRDLPVGGPEDVARRAARLRELCAPRRNPPRGPVQEALDVFLAAADRLGALSRARAGATTWTPGNRGPARAGAAQRR